MVFVELKAHKPASCSRPPCLILRAKSLPSCLQGLLLSSWLPGACLHLCSPPAPPSLFPSLIKWDNPAALLGGHEMEVRSCLERAVVPECRLWALSLGPMWALLVGSGPEAQPTTGRT